MVFKYKVGQTVWFIDYDGFAVKDKIKECVWDGVARWYIFEKSAIYRFEFLVFDTKDKVIDHFMSKVDKE